MSVSFWVTLDPIRLSNELLGYISFCVNIIKGPKTALIVKTYDISNLPLDISNRNIFCSVEYFT